MGHSPVLDGSYLVVQAATEHEFLVSAGERDARLHFLRHVPRGLTSANKRQTNGKNDNRKRQKRQKKATINGKNGNRRASYLLPS
jgi:hypothetical protein